MSEIHLDFKHFIFLLCVHLIFDYCVYNICLGRICSSLVSLFTDTDVYCASIRSFDDHKAHEDLSSKQVFFFPSMVLPYCLANAGGGLLVLALLVLVLLLVPLHFHPDPVPGVA